MPRNSIERGKWQPEYGEFSEVLKQLEDLHGTEVEISARGEYPTKQHPKVQHVAKWQNDGTATIKPARFVESAIRKHNGWQHLIYKSVSDYIWGANIKRLSGAMEKVSIDMNKAVNRIDTGRLKQSFTYRYIGKLKFKA